MDFSHFFRLGHMVWSPQVVFLALKSPKSRMGWSICRIKLSISHWSKSQLLGRYTFRGLFNKSVTLKWRKLFRIKIPIYFSTYSPFICIHLYYQYSSYLMPSTKEFLSNLLKYSFVAAMISSFDENNFFIPDGAAFPSVWHQIDLILRHNTLL